MKNKNKNLAMVLFVVTTAILLGSNIDAFADHTGSVGSSGNGELSACLNDLGTSPCDSGPEFGTNQIGNDALYSEGESAPISVHLENLPTADFHQLEVSWDIAKKTGGKVKHIFDYIATFNNDEDANACYAIGFASGCETNNSLAHSSSIEIPAPLSTTDGTIGGLLQPVTEFNALSTDEKQFWMFAPNGDTVQIEHIEYVSEGDPSFTASTNENTKIRVIFTTDATDVVAAFGAHIGSPDVWDFTAVDVGGNPYKVYCEGANGDGNSCSNHVFFTSDSIVPLVNPTVTIVKEVITLDGGNEGVDDFGLFVGASGPIASGTTVSISPDTDTSIGEVGLSGYTRIPGFAAGSSPECADTVNLPSNTDITCIIENDDDTASVTLNVSVLGGGNDAFTPTLDGVNVVSGDSNYVLANDPQTVDVVGDTSAYDVSITGDSECPANLGGEVTADEGEALTCNITLTAQQASVTLNVSVLGGGNDAFTPTLDGVNVVSGDSNPVTPNDPQTVDVVGDTSAYDVSITGDSECPANLGGEVTADEGEALTCNITLTAQQASVTLNVSVLGGGNDAFTPTLDGVNVVSGDSNPVTPNDPQTVDVVGDTSAYDVSITGDSECPANLGGEVTADEGEALTCNITLTAQQASVTLNVSVLGGGNDAFTPTLDGVNVVSGDSNPVTPNDPQTVDVVGDTSAYDVSITGDSECPANLGGEVTADEGEALTCNITLTAQQASVTLNVSVLGGGNDAFTPTLDGVNVVSGDSNPVTPNDPQTVDVVGDTSAYDVSITGDSECPANLGGEVTADEGEALTCNITLTAQQASVTLNVSVLGGGNDAFTPTLDGVNVVSGDSNPVTPNDPQTVDVVGDTSAYDVSITGDSECPANLGGEVTADEGEALTCNITLTAQQASVTLNVSVLGGGNDAFTPTLDGVNVVSGDSNPVTPNDPQTVDVVGDTSAYDVSITGDSECPANLGGEVTADEGEALTCNITLTAQQASVTLNVSVLGGGNDAFTPTLDGVNVVSGDSNPVTPNDPQTVDVVGDTSAYDVSITGDSECPANLGGEVTADEGEALTCNITLTAQQASVTLNVSVLGGGNDAFTPTLDGVNVVSGDSNPVTPNDPQTVDVVGDTSAYDVSITGDSECPANLGGEVTADEGEALTCNITLTAQQASVTLDLTVSGGDEDVNDFTLRLGGDIVADEISEIVVPNIAYAVNIDQAIVGYDVSLGGDEKCPNSLGGTVTPDEGETLTCTISLIANPAQITLEIDLTTDDGGSETEGDFTLLIDGGSVIPGTQNSVLPNKNDISINWTGPDGYTATISGNDKCPDVLGGNAAPLDEGDAISCTVHIDDIAPTLKLVKELTQDNGGEDNPGDWDLSAIANNNSVRDFTDSGDSDESHTIFANESYHLSEFGPSKYVPNAWTCVDANSEEVTVVNDTIILQPGDEVICTINNDDIPPGLTLQLILLNDVDGQALESDFVLSADGPAGFFGNGPEVGSGPNIVAGDYTLNATGPESYIYSNWGCSEEMLDLNTISIGVGDAALCSIIIEFIDNCPEVINPDQIDSDNDGTGDACEPKGGMNHWDTRPSFGVNHETRETMVVDSGFTFNGNSFTVTDNHHTPFDEQLIEIGAVNTFEATVWAVKDLKVQEFLFGVPEIGMGHLAEMRVEVWFDYTGEIEDIKVLQESEVIDRTSLSITHQKVKCQEKDTEEKCDKTSMSAVFLEPLADNVMAIKAMDFKLRDQTTYLNDGFDISGDSLNPMLTKMIPSPTKGEGLIEVTQNEKYSDYWSTDDGRLFEMNSFGSFQHINYSFERFQDGGNAFTRQHSNFDAIVNYEKQRASEIFDATALVSELPDSFTIDMPIGERITEEMIQEMIIQEHIAQKKLDKIMNQQTRWN